MQRIGHRTKAALGMVVCLVFGWFAFVRGARVPLLGLVDLGFHELGHMVAMWMPRAAYVMAGSSAQIAVPVGIAAYFFLQRDRFAGALCLAWAATSAQDVSVYIADAPYQRLELIGGEHDWAFLLGEHWHALDRASLVAACVKGLGAVLLFAGFSVCVWLLVMGEGGAALGSAGVPLIDRPVPDDSLPYAHVITEL